MAKIERRGYFFIVTSDALVRNLGSVVTLGRHAMALTIFPFIFVRSDTRGNDELLRHETIHIRQQAELLLVGAFLLYVVEFLYARYVKKLDARQAYYYTALEQEAHRNAMNEHYLRIRKPYAVLRYLCNKKMLARGEHGELIERDFLS